MLKFQIYFWVCLIFLIFLRRLTADAGSKPMYEEKLSVSPLGVRHYQYKKLV